MNLSAPIESGRDSSLKVLWDDGERVLYRRCRIGAGGMTTRVLVAVPTAEQPAPGILDRLGHEHALKPELDPAWAARPLELVHERGRTMLVLEDPGGEPLEPQLSAPMPVGGFLPLAIAIAVALGKVHQRGLVHKDIKPANILVSRATAQVWLTGFGVASRLPRERQSPEPPEVIAGTLAYMAPEQTGRMNRSIDSRSDLYSLGVTFYQMLVGTLPFAAADPMEWVHCHIARQPVSPAARANVPAPLSAVVMKLLAKAAEDRYQSAAGLEQDLRRCLAEWEAQGWIGDFPLGEHDILDRLFVPEKLYGREGEIATLLAAFDRVVKRGAPELVLVSGYSGIGKSSVVNELHRTLVPLRGLFASGKFDQYKRDIPYATLAQAFQSLIRPLLGTSDAELAAWRDVLREALNPNGQLIVGLVPELKLIIGEPPPVAELPPQDAQRRFQLVFRRFIRVFAREERPLALFLDDLQWLDAATLDLLEDLLIQPDLQHLFLIGAYRDNEVDAAHPLMRKLDAIRHAGASVREITLTPLAPRHLGEMIADALRCDPACAAPLVELVREKTAGNPFFVIQFLHALAEQSLLAFDHSAGRWTWDLERIGAKGYTDNVVDLMLGKLYRLPLPTREALQQLACLGNRADTVTLAIVCGTSEPAVHADLWEAVRQELVLREESYFRFGHDRVQEAAYSLISPKARAEAHLRIGRSLAMKTPPEKREEAVFEIVNQLNRATALITAQDEREQLAELNLIAGRRAKASSAYSSALAYLVAGAELLSENCWARRHELFFQLELNRAECEFLTGALPDAEERLATLSARTTTVVEHAAVTCLRIDLYTTLAQSDRAVAVCLGYLQRLGIEWAPHPTEEEAEREYRRIGIQLGSRTIDDLVNAPLMTDPECLATLDVLTKIMPAALFTDANLISLVTCRMVNLSLEHGNSDGSCVAYVWFGRIAGSRFGDYTAGLRFGQLGYELVERRGLQRYQARTYVGLGYHIMPWAKHVRAGRDLLHRAFDSANKIGDLTFAAYSRNDLNTNLLAAGDPLAEVQREAENGLAFARKARLSLVIDIITAQLGFIRTLRGLTVQFGSFTAADFDESSFERHLSSDTRLAPCESKYWTLKLQANFFAANYASAIEALAKAQLLLWTSSSHFETADYHFYGALSHAACCDSGFPERHWQHLQAMSAHHRQLTIWAENCPENFGNRAALVGAEIARIGGHPLDAERLYELAVRSARENGFVHNEAIAYERASAFYHGRGFEEFANLYLRNARYCYLRWGADGKVRQLDNLHPHLRERAAATPATSTIGARVEHLDLAKIIDVSQAVSGEMVLEKLIDALMRAAIQHAGAQRGLLILPQSEGARLFAEVTTAGGVVDVHVHEQPAAETAMPESLVHYVVRTREAVIIDDAMAENPFLADPYVRERHARSLLCLPLINQNKLAGVLYLENNLAPRVFTPSRIAVLQLLAYQAAISLENSRLYGDLQAQQTQIRRLVDCNIIGISISKADGRVLEANDAYLDLLGYNRDDLLSGRIRWPELTPAEWRLATERAWADLRETGVAKPFEKEYFRKNGSRVPVVVGASTIDEKGDKSVGFVLDLTERKRAEQALRDSEEQWRAVFEHNPTIYFMLDATGNIVSVNPFGAEQLGYTVDELIGRPVLDVVLQADRAAVERNAAACFEQGSRAQSWEARKVRKDGTIIWVRETARAVLIRQRPKLLLVAEDISQRKRVEHLTAQWFENSPDGIAIIGRDYRFQRVNRVFGSYWDVPSERIAGMSVAELRGREEFEQIIKERLDRCFAGHEQERQYTGWINPPIGLRYVIITYTPLRPSSEEVEGALVILHDITEYERAAEALREAQAELAHMNRVTTMGQLAATIAHEVNQPIAAAVTNAQAALRWLGAHPPHLGEVRQALTRTVADANRAGEVIGRIRAMVKKAPTRKEPVDINQTIAEVITLTRSEMLRNGVVLQARLGTNLPSLRGDRVQLAQVILNFVLNAVEAMKSVPEGSRELLILTERAGLDGMQVSVCDSGPGLSAEHRDRLFEPFHTTKSGGMGLGLSICRSIIEAHGGRIWASANLPGGASFQFALPACREAAP